MKVIAPTLTIAPPTIPNAIIGVPYSQQISVSAGAASTFVAATPLPSGFVLEGVSENIAKIYCPNPQTIFDAPVVIVAYCNDGTVGVVTY